MLGSKIRDMRNSFNLTQVQLAEKLGVKKQSICNWENDNVPPSVEMLRRMAIYFSCSTDALLELNEGRSFVDTEGLTPLQRAHIVQVVEDLRSLNKSEEKKQDEAEE